MLIFIWTVFFLTNTNSNPTKVTTAALIHRHQGRWWLRGRLMSLKNIFSVSLSLHPFLVSLYVSLVGGIKTQETHCFLCPSFHFPLLLDLDEGYLKNVYYWSILAPHHFPGQKLWLFLLLMVKSCWLLALSCPSLSPRPSTLQWSASDSLSSYESTQLYMSPV